MRAKAAMATFARMYPLPFFAMVELPRQSVAHQVLVREIGLDPFLSTRSLGPGMVHRYPDFSRTGRCLEVKFASFPYSHCYN